MTKLAALCAPGAYLVVKEAMPHNLFGRLGLKNPLMPTLEWEKHQTPELWIELLAQVGFREPRVRWTTLNTLRARPKTVWESVLLVPHAQHVRLDDASPVAAGTSRVPNGASMNLIGAHPDGRNRRSAGRCVRYLRFRR